MGFSCKNSGVSCHFPFQGIFWPRNWTHVFCIGRQILYHWATWEPWCYNICFQLHFHDWLIYLSWRQGLYVCLLLIFKISNAYLSYHSYNGDGQGGLVCCSAWGHRVEYDWAIELNWKCALQKDFSNCLIVCHCIDMSKQSNALLYVGDIICDICDISLFISVFSSIFSLKFMLIIYTFFVSMSI